jgi:hypothetical protein
MRRLVWRLASVAQGATQRQYADVESRRLRVITLLVMRPDISVGR